MFKRKQKEEKKKRPLWVRILKWSGIGILFLLILIILAPFLFKPQIINLIEQTANDNLNAEIEIGDVDLNLISTFPKFTLTLHDVKVNGVDKFDGITLADLPEVEAKLDFWSVVGGGKYTVKKLKLIEPKIYIKVLEDGSANYDIAIPDSSKTDPEEEVPFQLALSEYIIENGEFIYDDEYYATYVELNNMNHSGNLEINGDVYDLSTKTELSALTLIYDEVAYINKAKTDMDADLTIDMTEDLVLKFKENKVLMNALSLHADGAFIMDDRGYKFDNLALIVDESPFANFLSMIPTPYAVDLGDIKTDGTLAINALVNGYYADDAMPAMDLKFKVDKAMIQYPGMPSKIDNLTVDASIVKADENVSFDGMVIDIPKLNASFGGNTLSASLNVKNPESDPAIIANLLANVDLSTIKNIIPMEEGADLQGKLKSDVNLAGRMSSIDNEQYEKFDARGSINLTQFVYKEASLPDDVLLDSMTFIFSPQALDLANFSARIGQNDIKANGKIDNYLGYYFREELLHGTFNVSSNYLNADDFMTSTEETSASTEETSSDTSAMGVIPIPANIDFTLDTKVKQLVYNKIPINDVRGLILVKDERAELQELSLNTFGGNIKLNGSYETKNMDKPHIEMAYDITNIDIKSVAEAFTSVEKLAPVAKYCDGKISTNFKMLGDLSASMEPLYESLTGGGTMKSSKVEVSGFKPLEKLSSALNMDKLADQTLQNVNMAFEFKEGKVFVNPFDIKLGKSSARVEGNTSFEQQMDYTMAMKIPKSEIPQAALNAVDKAIGLAGNAGIKLSQLPNEIPVNVKMIGDVKDPTVTTDFKEQLASLTGNMKDQLNELKDSLINEGKEIIEDKVEEVKEDLKAKRDEILASAQKQADKVKADAKSAADKLRAEADKQYDEAVNAAGSNPVKKKAAELAAGKARDKTYEKANDLEAEANKKADKIMEEANAKANSLE